MKNKNPKVLLIGNIKGDGKSMSLVMKEYSQKFKYAKILSPNTIINKRLFKLLIYPFIILFYRGYDVYHVVDHSYGHLVYFLPKNKTIITCHDLIPVLFKEKFSHLAVSAFNFHLSGMRKANTILADSITKKQLIQHLKIKASKIKVMHHYINLSNFKELKNKKKLKEKYNLQNKKVILSFGYDFYKNVSGSLRALNEVIKKYPETILLKIGEFKEEDREIINEFNLQKNILIQKEVSEKTLVELYNCSDLLLFPCIYDGFYRPPLEAMACGTPVIIPNKPAFEEIKSNDSAIRINSHSTNELVKGIFSIFENNSLRQKLIKNGKKEVKKYTSFIEIHMPKLLKKSYQEILEKKILPKTLK